MILLKKVFDKKISVQNFFIRAQTYYEENKGRRIGLKETA